MRQLGRQSLDRGADQQQVLTTTLGGLARGLRRDLTHQLVERVDPDHEPAGIRRCDVIGETAVTGADVDRGSDEPRPQLAERRGVEQRGATFAGHADERHIRY